MWEFLKKTFGSSETGPQWGGIGSTVLFTAIGASFGGIGGAIAGALGGVVAGPIFNEILFNVKRSMGLMEPPPRTNKIEPKKSTEDLPAPVKQPDGTKTPTTVRAAILENMVPPPESGLTDAFKARDELRVMLNTRKGTEGDYTAAEKKARGLETHTESFVATVQDYFIKADDYNNGTKSKREELKRAVESSQKDVPNKMTLAEIEEFVPKLRTQDAEARARNEKLLADAVPDTVELFAGAKEFPLAGYAQGKFLRATTGTKGVDYGDLSDWNKKSSYEKLNYLLSGLDRERAQYEYKAPLNWKLIGNEELQTKSATDMYDYAVKELAIINGRGTGSVETEDNHKRKAELDSLKRYAQIVQARSKAQDLMTTNVGKVVGEYTEFHKTISADSKLARHFAKERLDVYNTSGIAVFAEGSLPKTKGPDGKECFTLTYKDCGSETPSGLITLVAQVSDKGAFEITHRVAGTVTEASAPDWAAAKLKAPVAVDKALFTELKGKDAGATLRTMLAAVKASGLNSGVALDMTMPRIPDLSRLFQTENGAAFPQLTAATSFADPTTSAQPVNNSGKKKEKAATEVVP